MSERVRGATSVSLAFRLTDVTTGEARTGLDVTALRLQFARPAEAPSAATALTLLGSQTAAFTPFGAVEKDGTHSPGVYRVDCPNGAFAAGADEVTLTVTGAAIQPATRLIGLVTLDARAANPPADWLNAAAVKADAVTKVQAGLSTYAGADTPGTTTALAALAAAGGLILPGVVSGSPSSAQAFTVDFGAVAVPAANVKGCTLDFRSGANVLVKGLVTAAVQGSDGFHVNITAITYPTGVTPATPTAGDAVGVG